MPSRTNSIPWKKWRKLDVLAAAKKPRKKAWKIAKLKHFQAFPLVAGAGFEPTTFRL